MPHIKGFNALRAISVLLVIASHIEINGLFDFPLWKSFFLVFNANFGVKTFFVLSGFLITTILLREHAATGGIGIRNFMGRRALRIFPLYFLSIGIAVFLAVCDVAHINPASTPYLVFFTYNFAPVEAWTSYFNHFWSLAIEEQFYLVWPLVLLLCVRRPGRLLLGAVAFVLLCTYLDANRNWSHFITYRSSRDWTIPKVYPIIVGCSFAIAIACEGFWLKPMRKALQSNYTIALAAILLLSPVFVKLPVMASDLADAGGVGILIAWVYLNQNRRSVDALEWKPLAYIGIISYGLYIWQGLLTGNGPYRYPGFPDFPISPPWLGAIVTFPVAMLSYHFFERPILRLKRTFEPKHGLAAVGAKDLQLSNT